MKTIAIILILIAGLGYCSQSHSQTSGDIDGGLAMANFTNNPTISSTFEKNLATGH